MNLVFFGSADFAVPSLDILLQKGYNIVGVVTAPDRLGGRGKKQVLMTAIKKYAVKNNLNVLQPGNLKSKKFNRELSLLNPDLQVVVAFRMLPVVVWSLPKFGTFNLHSSLLPKYRGAAPINWAIVNGEVETGCSTFFIDEKIDTGELLYQEKITIKKDETAGELHDRLMVLGASLVHKTVEAIKNKRIKAIPQNDKEVTHAPKIFREECKIDFNKTTTEVYNLIRGMSPYPGAWCPFENGEIKILKAIPRGNWFHKSEPGQFLATKSQLFFFTKDGAIEAEFIKFSGKKAMSTSDFLNGFSFE